MCKFQSYKHIALTRITSEGQKSKRCDMYATFLDCHAISARVNYYAEIHFRHRLQEEVTKAKVLKFQNWETI